MRQVFHCSYFSLYSRSECFEVVVSFVAVHKLGNRTCIFVKSLSVVKPICSPLHVINSVANLFACTNVVIPNWLHFIRFSIQFTSTFYTLGWGEMIIVVVVVFI